MPPSKHIKRLLIEALLVFILIIVGLFIEVHSRGLIFQNNEIRFDLIWLIILRSAIATVVFVVGYRILKTNFSFIFNLFRRKSRNEDEGKDEGGALSLLSDVFVILSGILVSIPIRPILQKTFKESDIENFTYVFVRHDALFSVLVLLIPAIPLIFFIAKHRKGSGKFFQIAEVLIAMVIIGAINSGPNFDARVYETRARWITRDWNKQGTDAGKALHNAETDEEKAIAYFWLGVSENRKGNSVKAIEYQREAIALMPSYGAAHASLANAYRAEKQYANALKHAQLCVTYDPQYAWCYQALANYYWTIGELDNAIIAIKKAIELDADNRELKVQYDEILKYKQNSSSS